MTKDYKNEFYVDTNGVVRWNSNDQVPFDDMLTTFLVRGFIEQENVIMSMNTRKAEAAKAIESYVANRQKYGYSDEERFEMRAAFGGEEVVDIFTGEVVSYE